MVSYNDPAFPSQWELGPSGVRLAAVLDEYDGRGIRIGVVDTGIDYTGPELLGKVDIASSWNALTGSNDPLNLGGDQHGTWVAERLAARANNGVGGIGAAPGATLVGFKMDTRALRTPTEELDLLQRQGQVDISHNSWSYSGESFRDNFLGAYAAQGAAIAAAAAQGRGGLGTVIIRSAGNDGAAGDSVNAHNYQNNRFTITVGATDASAQVQGFSNRGAALSLVAPADATSFAAPLVSGAVAAMLQARPDLGYRDVQQILALTAQLTDAGKGWQANAAIGWNGGGLRFSPDAGFGLLDARAALRLAETWDTPAKTEANLLSATAAGSGAGGYIGGDVAPLQARASIGTAIAVERAEVQLDLRHGLVGDLVVTLVSPSGTESVLLNRPMKGTYYAPGDRLTFALDSTNFLGESGQGDWTLRIQDASANGQTGTLLGWSLTLTGAPPSADTRYVYTDRYAGSVDLWPERTALADPGGTDTLNAAAVATASFIDLAPGGAATRIAGRMVAIAATTLIENAEGGDGNDTILGNEAANRLRGWRGDDRIEGHGGADTLVGGAGNDTLVGGTGADWLAGGAGSDLFLFAPGDGADWVEDFLPGTDRLQVLGFDAAALSANAATRLGIAGTLLGYGADSVFLAHLENASLATILGGTAPPPPPTGTSIGTGPDALVLRISEDAYLGDAQYTVRVDGVQLGGVLTAQASHAAGLSDLVTLRGDWGPGAHQVAVTFLNDAWGGSSALDRNLYLDGASYNGQAIAGATATLQRPGSAGFSFVDADAGPTATLTLGAGPDTLVLRISEDAYQGDAQYTVSVDGVQIGGVLTATASHAAGQSDLVTLRGDWAPGAHQVAVTFLNDAWGGSSALDRNLYLDGASYNGQAIAGATAVLQRPGPAGFGFTDATATAAASLELGSGAQTVRLGISQDAYLGSAQYTVKVDGVAFGGTLTASAAHGSGLDDSLLLHGDWGAGRHAVAVSFLNDRWDGTPATDRNLYVDSASHDGAPLSGAPAALMSQGTAEFAWFA